MENNFRGVLTCRVVVWRGRAGGRASVAPPPHLQLLQPVEHQLLGYSLWAGPVHTVRLLVRTKRVKPQLGPLP